MPVDDVRTSLAKQVQANWESYEQVAQDLLDRFAKEFGVDFFEGKQYAVGKESGTTWQIDGKGVRTKDGGILVVECKRWSDKVPKSIVGNLAYQIIDLEGFGGIVVSPLGFQSGAKEVAAARDIIEVTLTKDSTSHDFEMGFLNKFKKAASLSMFLKGEAPATAAPNEPKDQTAG